MKELEDYNWFPPVLRNFQTDFIGFVAAAFGIYDDFILHLKTLSVPEQLMTDLCSGSGEPAISVFKKSKRFSKLTLTDKYPVILKLTDNTILYDPASRDVNTMEFKAGTCYTMFNAFHHFSDDEKLRIIQKIKVSGATAFFVEILEPKIGFMFKVLAVTTIGCILITPFVRPFSVKRLIFTYLIPVNIFTISFDGIISVLRSRSLKHYQRLFSTEKAVTVFRLKNCRNSVIVTQIQQ